MQTSLKTAITLGLIAALISAPCAQAQNATPTSPPITESKKTESRVIESKTTESRATESRATDLKATATSQPKKPVKSAVFSALKAEAPKLAQSIPQADPASVSQPANGKVASPNVPKTAAADAGSSVTLHDPVESAQKNPVVGNETVDPKAAWDQALGADAKAVFAKIGPGVSPTENGYQLLQ